MNDNLSFSLRLIYILNVELSQTKAFRVGLLLPSVLVIQILMSQQPPHNEDTQGLIGGQYSESDLNLAKLTCSVPEV